MASTKQASTEGKKKAANKPAFTKQELDEAEGIIKNRWGDIPRGIKEKIKGSNTEEIKLIVARILKEAPKSDVEIPLLNSLDNLISNSNFTPELVPTLQLIISTPKWESWEETRFVVGSFNALGSIVSSKNFTPELVPTLQLIAE
ncbi:MAG: hypothetical protein D6797_08240, partial [Bdellovibrio sp.]